VYATLAAVTPEPGGMTWTAADVRRRARRVLLGLLRPTLDRLPATTDQWDTYLPVTQISYRTIAPIPSGSTCWADTVREFGWPPTSYHQRERRREVDDVALSSLAWLARRLDAIVEDVEAVAPSVARGAHPVARTLAHVALSRLADTTPARPDRLDLRSLAASGFPWSVLAELAEQVGRAETDLQFLAYELIQPDPESVARLFHLAILGEVIRSFQRCGFDVRWRAPLQAVRQLGPQLVVTRGEDRWEIWYEAAGARAYYRLPAATYGRAVEHIPGAGGAIGSDIAVIGRESRSLLLEVKWSPRPSYVGRSGFHQAMSYALDARLGVTPEVWSFLVGPAEVVLGTSVSDAALAQASILVGSMNVGGVGGVVEAFVRGDPASIPVGVESS